MNANQNSILPASVLVNKQVKTYGPRTLRYGGELCKITATVRHDDGCGNGHNSFSITGVIYDAKGRDIAGGCVHKEVAKAFPELAPFIKWHLTSTDGPMHYVANTVYLAGDRDHWGLRKGEFRQHLSRGPLQAGGVAGVPCWELKLPARGSREVYANTRPAPVVCEWVPYGTTGDGKDRELDAARRAAVWPEATDEQLTQDPVALKAELLARLPALMQAFKRDVESLGFTY